MLFILKSAHLRESDFILVPLQALDGVSLPPQVALELSTKLVWHATARPLHGPVGHKTSSAHDKARKALTCAAQLQVYYL